MRIVSPAFQENDLIPEKYTCRGPNVNPPLEFHDVPRNARSLVLILEDVDAPSMPWVHWLVFNIPPAVTRCPEHSLPRGGTEGLANGGTFGYEGPCQKYFKGTHHYHFKLYALDQVLPFPADTDRPAILAAMEGHILAEAELTGLAEGDGSAI